MNNRILKIIIISLLFVILQSNCTDLLLSDNTIEIKELRCEYLINPLGIDVKNPRLSWKLKSDLRGQKQTAYQILVASSEQIINDDRGDLWDSDTVNSSQSTHIRYDGNPLKSNQACYWKVRVWDKDSTVSSYSDVASFSMALLHADGWQAKWIGRGPSTEPRGRMGFLMSKSDETALDDTVQFEGKSTLLRKKIEIEKSIERAWVYVCGLGFYELYINGNKVGDAVLSPAKTHYRQQVLYDTYDITEILEQGENALGIMLGNGWFNPYKKWWSWRMQWFGSQRAILQLHIDYSDGTSAIVISDDSWKASTGPVIYSCIYDGERYDANKEQVGWSSPDFNDMEWKNVNIVEAPGGHMISQMMEPIEVTETIKPVALTNLEPGVYVYDMGQNFTGWIRLTVTGPKGTKVVMRYSENIDQNGEIETRSMNLAEATGMYILKGEGREVYEPKFSYYGFRYVEVTGFPGTPQLENIEGRVVHSACKLTGRFVCGNELLNRIHKNTLWSQRSNMVGYPMDCPQRDERLGWMGDAHVTAEEAMLNFHMPLFYRNWLSGIQDNQDEITGDIPYISPRPFMEGGDVAWSSGYILIVWYYYLHYGDKQILENHYESMKRYVEFLGSQAKQYILPRDQYGDWVSVVYNWQRGDPESVTTAYYYYNSTILSKTAELLGNKDQAIHYSNLAKNIRNAYNQEYLNLKENQYEAGSQCSNAFPLFLGLVPELHQKAVLKSLIDDILLDNQGHLTTGILGSKYMMEALTNNNRSDVAYLLAAQTDYPSWGDLIKNRTTLSEHWNQSGSNNHVMFGSVDTWFYRTLAGINIDQNHPGYENVIIKPFIHPELGWVEGSVETVKGEVSTRWELKQNNLTLEIKIPTNTSGTVYLLANDEKKVTESESPLEKSHDITYMGREGDYAIYQIGSGYYKFKSPAITDILPKSFAAKPIITPKETFITIPDTIAITMTSTTPGAAIHYTLNETEPSEESSQFNKPITLKKSTMVKAIAIKEGYHPSFCQSVLYTFVDPKMNGLQYELYQGAFTHLPDFQKMTPIKKGRVFQFDLSQIEHPDYDFALKFSGTIETTKEGVFTFYTVSNDGSQLFINKKLVVDNDGEHTASEQSGKIFLTAGRHDIEVTYFQSGGGKELTVFYAGPGVEKQSIPAWVLYDEQ